MAKLWSKSCSFPQLSPALPGGGGGGGGGGAVVSLAPKIRPVEFFNISSIGLKKSTLNLLCLLVATDYLLGGGGGGGSCG